MASLIARFRARRPSGPHGSPAPEPTTPAPAAWRGLPVLRSVGAGVGDRTAAGSRSFVQRLARTHPPRVLGAVDTTGTGRAPLLSSPLRDPIAVLTPATTTPLDHRTPDEAPAARRASTSDPHPRRSVGWTWPPPASSSSQNGGGSTTAEPTVPIPTSPAPPTVAVHREVDRTVRPDPNPSGSVTWMWPSSTTSGSQNDERAAIGVANSTSAPPPVVPSPVLSSPILPPAAAALHRRVTEPSRGDEPRPTRAVAADLGPEPAAGRRSADDLEPVGRRPNPATPAPETSAPAAPTAPMPVAPDRSVTGPRPERPTRVVVDRPSGTGPVMPSTPTSAPTPLPGAAPTVNRPPSRPGLRLPVNRRATAPERPAPGGPQPTASAPIAATTAPPTSLDTEPVVAAVDEPPAAPPPLVAPTPPLQRPRTNAAPTADHVDSAHPTGTTGVDRPDPQARPTAGPGHPPIEPGPPPAGPPTSRLAIDRLAVDRVVMSDPAASHPNPTDPVTSIPVATDPATSDPMTVERAAPDRAATRPVNAEPATNDRMVVDRAVAAAPLPPPLPRPTRPARPVLGRPVEPSKVEPAAGAGTDPVPGQPDPIGPVNWMRNPSAASGSQDVSAPFVVARAPATDVAEVAPAPTPAGAAATAASTVVAPAAAAGATALPADLADQLYTKIERRLRMELLMEAERKGSWFR